VIANHGKPVARLTRVPEPPKKKIPWGKFKGTMADDFDAPLEQLAEYIGRTPDEQIGKYEIHTLW
jgi:antitoxin (DNA-binding transcriptional repressor) of toxin-antitoxin stability system